MAAAPFRFRWRHLLVSSLLLASAGAVIAQGRFHRRHTAEEAKPLRLMSATEKAPSVPEVQIDHEHGHRHVHSNAIPQHPVGRFPNRGNPNSISEQRYDLNLPLDPQIADRITPLIPQRGRPLHVFGIAVNGVAFEPGAGEFWQGHPRSGWTYEPLGGAVPLGLDENHAHVQPTGKYHYHGLPTGLLERLGNAADKHSALVGWAADGFPIYAQYGYADPEDPGSTIIELKTSYRLKRGERPGGREPSGPHDGAFVQDYEYEPGLGDLDECNGRQCVTPEFPEGTYAYFLTTDWPVIPRAFRGEPAVRR